MDFQHPRIYFHKWNFHLKKKSWQNHGLFKENPFGRPKQTSINLWSPPRSHFLPQLLPPGSGEEKESGRCFCVFSLFVFVFKFIFLSSHCIPNVWISDFLHLMDGRIHLRIAFIALLGHFCKKATGSVSLACRTSRWPSLRLFPPQSEQVNPLEVEKFHSKCPGQSQSSVRIHYGRFVGRMVWYRYQNQAAQKHASYLTQSLHLLHIEGNLPQLLWCEGLSA